MPEWGQSYTAISRLRVRYRGVQQEGAALALHLRAERLLDTVDLRPTELLAGKVLIVHRVSGLEPLSLATPMQLAPPAWAEKLRQVMASLYAQAERPALGPVSSSAASVLFSDPAEMLACLTNDLLIGRARQQWYWQQVLRGVPEASGAALTKLWSEQAQFLPAALSYMGSAKAQAAIVALSPQEVSQVIAALHERFDLTAAAQTVMKSGALAPPLFADASTPPGQEDGNLALDLPAPPWQRWVPGEALSALPAPRHYLLGLGLTLHYAPTFARSSTFTAQATTWLRAQLAIQAIASNRSLTPDRQKISSEPSRSASSQDLERRPRPQQVPMNGSPNAPKREEPSSTDDLLFGATQLLPQDGIPTQLAGALYLINLLTWLHLPGGWEEDGALAEHLSGWSMLEMLARGLLGTIHQSYLDDPLWKVLATLDGRAPEVPIGASLPQQSAFRLPAKWLRHAGAATPAWIAATNKKSLLLFDEQAHYLAADCPLAGRSFKEAITAEVKAYQTQGIAPSWRMSTSPALPKLDVTLSSVLSPTAAWWLARVLGFVRFLLSRVLGVEPHDTEALARMLLYRSGQILVSHTHLDLHMPLDAISVPVRRAGLDCDPGWAPDFGRIILFHFD